MKLPLAPFFWAAALLGQPVATYAKHHDDDRAHLEAHVAPGAVKITRGDHLLGTILPRFPMVEQWKFDNDDEQIILKSRARHGPAMVEKFETRSGRLLDRVWAYDVKRVNARWARGFEE